MSMSKSQFYRMLKDAKLSCKTGEKSGLSRAAVDVVHARVTGLQPGKRNAKMGFGQWIEALHMTSEEVGFEDKETPQLDKIQGFLTNILLPNVKKETFAPSAGASGSADSNAKANEGNDARIDNQSEFLRESRQMVEGYFSALDKQYKKAIMPKVTLRKLKFKNFEIMLQSSYADPRSGKSESLEDFHTHKKGRDG